MFAFLLGWKENSDEGEGEIKRRGEERRERESVIHIKLLWSVNVEMFPPLDLPNSSFFQDFIKLFILVLLSN